MNRDALLTFALDDGLYEAPLLQGVRLEEGVDTIVGQWDYFGIEAEGSSASDVYRDVLSILVQRSGNDPSAPNYQPLAALVREHGRMLSAAQIIEREDKWLREVVLPWTVSADHRYQVELFKDVVIRRGNGEVGLTAFGITRAAPDFGDSFDELRRAISEACGSRESPGPRFLEISSWVSRNGQPISVDEARQASRLKAQLDAVHAGVIDVEPDEVTRLSSTQTLLLLQFWGNRCGWCVVQAPVLAELSEALFGRVMVRKMDADRHGDMAGRYEVSTVPTVLLLRGGHELHRIEGHRGTKTILRELRPHLGLDI